MQAVRRVAQPNVRKLWTSDIGVYPIIGVVATACTWGIYNSVRGVVAEPDTQFDRTVRGQRFFSQEHAEAGKKWRDQWQAKANKGIAYDHDGSKNVMPGFRKLTEIFGK